MLPFLKPQAKQTGVAVAMRKPDGGGMEAPHDDDKDAGLHAASEDLIRALNAKDAHGVSAALRAAFEILDSEPHVEGEHTNE